MTIMHRRWQVLIILAGFGILIPNLLLMILLGNPDPASWPIPARIVSTGILMNALVSVLFPRADSDED